MTLTARYHPLLWLRRFLMAMKEALDNRETTTEKEREIFFLNTIDKYAGVIAAICHTFASSETEFQDLHQDALCNIWKGLHDFRNRANLKTWIYRVTLNSCVSTYRKTPKGVVKVGLEGAEGMKGVESGFEDAEWLEIILKSLPQIDRSILLMWLDDLSYEEIAEVMGMNKNTVATRLHRTKLRIRNAYASA